MNNKKLYVMLVVIFARYCRIKLFLDVVANSLLMLISI